MLPGAGEALELSAPISFWGGVDPKNGKIADVRHPEHGARHRRHGAVPAGTIGSSSASAVLLELELVRGGSSPAGGCGSRRTRA